MLPDMVQALTKRLKDLLFAVDQTNALHGLKGRSVAYNIFQVLDTPVKMDCNTDNGSTLAIVQGNIELQDIVFSYPSRPEVMIFNCISLTIPVGRTLAIVGGSRSGKSMVVSLIERFYDPLAGQVLLDGDDIRSLQLKWLKD